MLFALAPSLENFLVFLKTSATDGVGVLGETFLVCAVCVSHNQHAVRDVSISNGQLSPTLRNFLQMHPPLGISALQGLQTAIRGSFSDVPKYAPTNSQSHMLTVS